jgi:hypothetical protein
MGVVVIDGKEDTSTTNQDIRCIKSAKERLHEEAARVDGARVIYVVIIYLFIWYDVLLGRNNHPIEQKIIRDSSKKSAPIRQRLTATHG